MSDEIEFDVNQAHTYFAKKVNGRVWELLEKEERTREEDDEMVHAAHTSLFHWEGWPFAPAEPALMVLVGFGVVYLMVGIYITSALISKKHRAPYDWVAGSYVTKS